LAIVLGDRLDGDMFFPHNSTSTIAALVLRTWGISTLPRYDSTGLMPLAVPLATPCSNYVHDSSHGPFAQSQP
jgi:hypothetical protein